MVKGMFSMSMTGSPPFSTRFTGAAVIMGVTGSGKTTVGKALAQSMGSDFIEGDDLHPADNITRMSSGIALTDDDRWQWLARVGQGLANQEGVIASCSALKRRYREAIAEAARKPVLFVFLRGSRGLLEERLRLRKGHFMPATLLESQLAILEAPDPDESAIAIDITADVNEIVKRARIFLLAAKCRH